VCRIVEYAGSGTDTDPYQVTNTSQLQCIESQDLSAHYVLTSDIDASNTSEYYDGAGFDPIGSSSTPFTGTFDGDEHVITGLTIDRPGTDYVGLFGATGGSATVTDVGLEGVSITGDSGTGGLVGQNAGTVRNAYARGSVDGYRRIGGLIGDSSGTVANSYASGSVTSNWNEAGGLIGALSGGSVTGSNASAEVNGGGYSAGGLIGDSASEATVQFSYATGSVSLDQDDAGGLVGQNDGTVRFSYATGEVGAGGSDAGGLIGQNGGTLANVYATGAVSSSNADDVGGLVGDNSGNVSAAYAAGDVSGSSNVGGLIGYNEGTLGEAYWDVVASGQSSATGSNTYGTVESSVGGFETDDGQGRAAEMIGDNAADNMTALDFESVWTARTDDYPTFLYRVGNAPPIAEADEFLIEGNLSRSAPGVLGNDIDIENDPLSASPVSDPSNGTVTVASDGSFEYVPDTGFTGQDTFTYEVSDGNNTATANVTIFVAAPRGAPARQVSDYGWTSWHGQPENRNFNATIDGPRQPVTQRWNTAFPDGGCCVPMRPIVANDTVFAFSYESTFAMDARNGSVLWSNTSVPGTYLGGIAYEDGRIFVSSSDGNFYALHATGRDFGIAVSAPTIRPR